MYLAMDELGVDNFNQIKSLSKKDKWHKIIELATFYQLDGIQLTPSLYEEKLGLSLNDLPNKLTYFRLTYHLGGLKPLFNEMDYMRFNEDIRKSFLIAKKYKIEDVSLHPPFGTSLSIELKNQAKLYLTQLLNTWVPLFHKENITLSLETHVTKEFFIFDGLNDFAHYVSNIDGLGILIDLSHNYFDHYTENEIISLFKNLNVTGLHISDANHHVDFNQGTHLPISKGHIHFKPIIQAFKDKAIYGAFEIKGTSIEIKSSIEIIQSYLKN